MKWSENPCRFCTKETGRSQHCHSTCEHHKEWLVENELKRKFEKNESNRRQAIITSAFERMNRTALKRKQEGRK